MLRLKHQSLLSTLTFQLQFFCVNFYINHAVILICFFPSVTRTFTTGASVPKKQQLRVNLNIEDERGAPTTFRAHVNLGQ